MLYIAIPGESSGFQRSAEQIALNLVTAFVSERHELLLRLHTLGDDAHAEALAQADDRPDNSQTFRPA